MGGMARKERRAVSRSWDSPHVHPKELSLGGDEDHDTMMTEAITSKGYDLLGTQQAVCVIL